VTKEVLQEAAERAWHKSFRGEDESSKYFVVQEAPGSGDRAPLASGVTFVKVGTWLLTLLQASRPYLPGMSPHAFARFLPQAAQRDAWLAHNAWVAIDCQNYDRADDLKYCVLANLAAELLDDNVAGVYFPAKRTMAPHDDQLYRSLKGIAPSGGIGID
jgi:hypothetical protein